jgi:hypothetical protein
MENQDKVHKKRFSANEIEEFILQYQASGKNKRKFTQEKGLNYYTFGTWVDKANKKETSPSRFKEIKIQSATSMFAQVHLPGGIKIDFYQAVPATYFHSLI